MKRTPLADELVQRYLDGEVDADERAAVETRLAEDAETRRRVEAGREIGSLVRAYTARGLDEAKLGGLVDDVMALVGEEAAVTATVPRPQLRTIAGGNGAARTRAAGPREQRSFVRRHAWTLAVGLAAAAAVIIFMVTRRPEQKPVAQPDRPSPTQPAPSDSPRPIEVAVVGVSNQASIESIDVPGAASAIFTIPDDTGDGNTTVIWLSDDEGEAQ